MMLLGVACENIAHPQKLCPPITPQATANFFQFIKSHIQGLVTNLFCTCLNSAFSYILQHSLNTKYSEQCRWTARNSMTDWISWRPRIKLQNILCLQSALSGRRYGNLFLPWSNSIIHYLGWLVIHSRNKISNTLVLLQPLRLRWLCDSPRMGCAWRTNICVWREQAIIEWSHRVISIVACCHGAKLCTYATRDFRSQQNGAVTKKWRSCRVQPSHKKNMRSVWFVVKRRGCCCNLSGGVALIVWFITNEMCVKNKNMCVWREQAIIEWSSQVISILACCHGAKLCAYAARDFRSQQYEMLQQTSVFPLTASLVLKNLVLVLWPRCRKR